MAMTKREMEVLEQRVERAKRRRWYREDRIAERLEKKELWWWAEQEEGQQKRTLKERVAAGEGAGSG